VGKRRGTLTTSRELPARKHAGRTHCLCPKNLNILPYYRGAPPGGAAIFRSLAVCLTCLTNFAHISRSYHHNEERARGLAYLGHHSEFTFTPGCEGAGGAPNWEVGEREKLQHLGLCILTGMTTNLSIFSRENLSIESLLLGLCLEF
jgi:hypothetical protein